MKQIRIFRWAAPNTPHNNFGDEITVPILSRLFGIEAVPSSMADAQLIGSGSILDAWWQIAWRRKLSDFLRRPHRLHVWGSGFILPNSKALWPRRVRYHAVRGSQTAQRIGRKLPLGDPGILASLLIDRPSKSDAVGIVPHYIDVAKFPRQIPKHWKVIDPMGPVDDVLREIGSCGLIMSSSLHGLITADSFGIPCVWAKTEQPLYGSPDYKFLDYATGRRAAFNNPISYADALSISADRLGSLATMPARSVSDWQQEISNAFPFA